MTVQIFYRRLSHPKALVLITILYYRVFCKPRQMVTHHCRQQPMLNSLISVDCTRVLWRRFPSGSQPWLISSLVVLVRGWESDPMVWSTTTLTSSIGPPDLTFQSVGSPPERPVLWFRTFVEAITNSWRNWS